MQPDATRTPGIETLAAERRLPWVTPGVADLPRLIRLTLQTGDSIPGGGGTGGSGSTVVP